MKVMWICNIEFPKVSELLGESVNNFGGWLVNTAEKLSEIENIELNVLYTKNNITTNQYNTIDDINFIAIPKNNMDEMVNSIKDVLSTIKPDILHIHGTEEEHSFAAIKACDEDIKILLSIQGIVSKIGKYYESYLPKRVVYKHQIRDFIKNSSIINQKKKFEKKGNTEKYIIRNVDNITGRTEWDEACIKSINKNVNYYSCNETLRKIFYEKKWSLDSCEKYSIFMSQGSYPIKGLHFILKIMPQIIKKFPEAHLYIAGPNIIDDSNFIQKFKQNSYGRYIKKLIEKGNLKNKVTFLGNLTESEMCDRYLKSNIYICPSTLENSPNSLGEAMILGMPCIASFTGGIPSMLTHGEDGFLFPVNHEYMLYKYIEMIFNHDDLAVKLGQNARKRACVTHNEKLNLDKLVNIYKDILS